LTGKDALGQSLMLLRISRQRMRWHEPTAFATKQRPFIPEEALPVVDCALVFPPGPLKKTGEVGDLPLFDKR